MRWILLVLLGAAWLAWLGREPARNFSIHGVKPGMSRAEVYALLGPDPNGVWLDAEANLKVSVVWRGDRVATVHGNQLELQGHSCLRSGDPVEAMSKILGEPRSIRDTRDERPMCIWARGRDFVYGDVSVGERLHQSGKRYCLQSFSLP